MSHSHSFKTIGPNAPLLTYCNSLTHSKLLTLVTYVIHVSLHLDMLARTTDGGEGGSMSDVNKYIQVWVIWANAAHINIEERGNKHEQIVNIA